MANDPVQVGDIVYWYGSTMDGVDPLNAIVEGLQPSDMLDLSVIYHGQMTYRISVPRRDSASLKINPQICARSGCWERRSEWSERQAQKQKPKAAPAPAKREPVTV
jgi:hypothetical protein